MELRPYQKEAKEAIFEQWDSGVLKTLLVLPTGCGKTVVFAKVTEECVRKGDRVLILAHRGELLDQAADKLMKTTGLGCALEKAESSCQGSWFRVVVGSVQTLMREKRLGSFPADYFNTIIIDEAHHCISDSCSTLFSSIIWHLHFWPQHRYVQIAKISSAYLPYRTVKYAVVNVIVFTVNSNRVHRLSGFPVRCLSLLGLCHLFHLYPCLRHLMPRRSRQRLRSARQHPLQQLHLPFTFPPWTPSWTCL